MRTISTGTQAAVRQPWPSAAVTTGLAAAFGLAVAYGAAGRVVLLSTNVPRYEMAVWLPGGIALAGLLLFGYRAWPGILIGSFFTALGADAGGESAGVIFRTAGVAGSLGVGAVLQAAIGAALIRRFVGFPKALDEAEDVAKFLILGGPTACAIGVTWNIATLTIAGSLAWPMLPLAWSTEWVASSIGVMLVTPLILVWFGEPRAAWRARRSSVGLPVLAALILAVLVLPKVNAWELAAVRYDFGQRPGAPAHATTQSPRAGAVALTSTGSLGSGADENRRTRLAYVRPWAKYLSPQQLWQVWAVLATALAFTGLLTSLLLIVTGRARKSEALALENSALYKRYRSLFEGVPVGLYRATEDGRILDVNPAFLRILDYPNRDALVTVNAASFYLDAQLWERWRAQVERDAVATDVESQLKRSDGSLVWVQASISATRDPAGRTMHYEGAIVDITERKQAQAQVEALNEIVAAAAGAADLPTFLGTLLDRTLSALEGDAGGGWLGAGGFVHRHMPRGLSMEMITAAAEATGPALTRVEAVENWEPTTGPLADTLGSVLRRAGVRGSILAPLLVDGRRIGGLLIMTARPRRWRAAELKLVEAVGRQVGAVAERLQLLDDVRAHARDLEALHSLGAALRRTTQLGEIYGLVTQRTMVLLSGDYAELALSASDGREFQRVCVHAGQGFSIGTTPPVGEGIVAAAIERAGALVITDLSAASASKGVPGPTGTPTGPCLAVPLREGERVIGALIIARRRGSALGPFASRDMNLATALAELASHAIDRTQLAQQVERELANVRGLYESAQRMAETLDLKDLADGAVRECVEKFGATAAWIAKLDDAGRPLCLAHHAGEADLESLLGEWIGSTTGDTFRALLTAGKPVVVDDLKTHADAPVPAALRTELRVRAAGIFPLTRRTSPAGALVLYTNRPAYFSDDRLEFLRAYTHQLAGALENAGLYEDSTRRLAQLQALHEIDQVIAGSSDLRASLNVVLTKTLAQLHADAASVLLLNPHQQFLEYAAGQGFVTNAPRHVRLRLGEGVIGQAGLERRCVGMSDLDAQPDMLRLIDAPYKDIERFKAAYAIPLIAKGQLLGVLCALYRRPMTPDDEGLEFLDMLARQTAIAISDAQQFRAVQRSRDELMLAYDTTLEGWARALELRDKETEGHTQRVGEMTVRLASRLNVPENTLMHIRRGALLHDIGKIAISDTILLKPGSLTGEERKAMELHPVYAYQLLSPISYLRPVLDIPFCHHEKWDGTGYPRGLQGEQIPLNARMFAIVDVWDALTQDRPYRRAWSFDRAREFIRTELGRHFDPSVGDAFLRMLEQEEMHHPEELCMVDSPAPGYDGVHNGVQPPRLELSPILALAAPNGSDDGMESRGQ